MQLFEEALGRGLPSRVVPGVAPAAGGALVPMAPSEAAAMSVDAALAAENSQKTTAAKGRQCGGGSRFEAIFGKSHPVAGVGL